MARKNSPRDKVQKSKRARLHWKQAEFAFGKHGRFMAHPSHISYRKNRPYKRTRKDWSRLIR